MNKITEDYVSYEIAKLLKKKGFDEPSRIWYDDKGVISQRYIDATSNPLGKNYSFAAPTQSLALKWLREVHNIHIEIRYMPGQFTDEPTYKAMIWNMDTEIGTPLSPDISYTYFETCIEAALKYTLENLI